jgi:glutamate decarboxylase
MAPHAETLKLLRVVVREDFSFQRARMFLRGAYELDFCERHIASLLIYLIDLVDTIKFLDKTPTTVLDHAHEVHKEKVAIKAEASYKQTDADDSHSLQGKHGKTHGVC